VPEDGDVEGDAVDDKDLEIGWMDGWLVVCVLPLILYMMCSHESQSDTKLRACFL
jgi:hypothetical protein